MIRTAVVAIGMLLTMTSATGEASRGSAPSRSCPKEFAGVKPTSNPEGSSVLVPARPSGLVLCRYGGLNNQPSLGLARAVRIKRVGRVRGLGRKLDALPEPTPGTSSCPYDDGSAIAAVFRYKNAAPVAVVVHLGGCGDVNNGRLHRTTRYAESLVKQLKVHTGCQPGDGPSGQLCKS